MCLSVIAMVRKLLGGENRELVVGINSIKTKNLHWKRLKLELGRKQLDCYQKCNKRLKRTKKSIKEENVNQQLRKRNL